jgi:hypothetical protein
MVIRRLLPVLALLAGCTTSHETVGDTGPGGSDAGHHTLADTGDDAASSPNPDGGSMPHDLPDGAIVMPPPGAVTCGAATCAAGQACCLLTLACFDPADTSACAIPSSTTDPDACASNGDCAAGELCEVNDIFSGGQVAGPACGGTVGHCVMQRPVSDCGGFGDGVCGCDGRTYPDPCAASRAGVRVSWYFPCGVDATASSIYECDAEHAFCPMGRHCDVGAGRCLPDVPTVACGIDAQCPAGYSCCGTIGLCMLTSCPECCFTPPPGASFPCVHDADCDAFSVAAGHGGGGPGEYYCGVGTGCGTPGGCMRFEGPCGGALAPVCGCDGVSYSNECWARMARTRIAHDGMCP